MYKKYLYELDIELCKFVNNFIYKISIKLLFVIYQ